MSDFGAEVELLKTHLLHHRIIIYAILFLLVILTLGFILFARQSRYIPIPTSYAPTPTAASGQEAAVAPETNYENPFDKNTQYVNPFKENKNPFDALK